MSTRPFAVTDWFGRYEVYVPEHDNAGVPMPPAVRARLEEHALEAFGGFTVGPESHGVWRDPATGHVYRDRVRVWTLFSDNLAAVLGFAEEVADLMQQEAVSVVWPNGYADLQSGTQPESVAVDPALLDALLGATLGLN